MNPLLLFVLQTSIVGSISFAFYLLLHPVRQKVLSAGWQYNLVKMLALFFVLPVGLLNAVSLLWQTSRSYFQRMEPASLPIHPATAFPITDGIVRPLVEPLVEPFLEPFAASPLQAASQLQLKLGNILFILWLSGALVYILHQMLSYWVFYSRVVRFNTGGANTAAEAKLCNEIACRMGLRKKISVVTNPKISGPMVFFGKSNTVVLPTIPITGENLKYVLYHELTHIKRHDLLVKFLFLCVTAIHWFNPLFYILNKQLDTWCELSCDERVVKHFSHHEKKEYGLSIINLMYSGKSQENVFCSTYACHKKNLKRRLNMLIKQNKYMKTKIAFSLALTVMMGSIGLTSGVLASSLDVVKEGIPQVGVITLSEADITVLETSSITGNAIKIAWNDKQYKLDENYINILESPDKGATWHEFRSNYDTMKLLYNGLHVEVMSIETYKAQVERMKNTPPVLRNVNPNAMSDWKDTIAGYESIISDLENGKTVENISLITEGISYEYIMPGYETYTNEAGETMPNSGIFGSNLDHLYQHMKTTKDYWVESEILTQAEADIVWSGFLTHYNLEK